MTTAIVRLAAVLLIAAVAAGCANTIRGVGHDAANTVDAVKRAGNNVADAAD